MRDALATLVGPDHVHDPADWLEDITEHPAGKAELTVSPGLRDEVVAVLLWAAAEGVSVTPVVAGYNVAGIAIPQGGIVLDLKRLDRLEVDEDTMTVIVEPGVTFEQLKAHLDEHHPDLAYTYPFAPPFTSVLMNALLDGLNNLSLPGGAMGRWITGVEAVLADGTVVRTGTGRCRRRVVRPGAAARPHRPVRLDAGDHRHRAAGRARARAEGRAPSRWFAFCWSLDDANRAMRALARTRSVDDVGCMTWPSAKLLFGATRDLVRADDEPLAFLFIDLTGASAAELDARRDLARGILAEAGVDPAFRGVAPRRADAGHGQAGRAAHHARLPPGLPRRRSGLGRVLRPAGRVGGRCHARARHARAPRLPAFLVARPMEGGRYHVLRYVACFDRGDAEEVGRVPRVHGRAGRRRARPRLRAVQGLGRCRGRIVERADPGGSRSSAACATRWTPSGA